MRALLLGRSQLGTNKTKETGHAFLVPGFIGGVIISNRPGLLFQEA
jgi:hypothetical protein